MAKKRRPSLTPRLRKLVRAKTHGRCHVCGGPLGRQWQADHVRPAHRGGQHTEDNYLPACWICNRARWHYGPQVIRKVIEYGVVAFKHLKRDTPLGRELRKAFRQSRRTKKRRRVTRK